MQADCQFHKWFASLRSWTHTGNTMSKVSPAKKKFLDVCILLILVGVAGVQVYLRFSRNESSSAQTEEDLLLVGLEPQPTRIPGRSIMGADSHDRLTDTVDRMKDQLSDLELMGLSPGSDSAEKPGPPPAEPPPAEPLPADPKPDGSVVSLPPEAPELQPEEIATVEPDPLASEAVEDIPEAEVSSTEGIWVRSSREGGNPIRVEDHVSVDAQQLAEMAGFRNISTDPAYPPPRFSISGVGAGRLGTYVIVDHQMIRLNGQIRSPTDTPRAWRLVEATASEVFWAPIED